MPNPNFDILLNLFFPSAQQLLDRHGEFYPFGGYIKPDGVAAVINAACDEEKPTSDQIIMLLLSALKDISQNQSVTTTGICLDVKVIPEGQTQKTDAVCARIECLDDPPLDIYLPYEKNNAGICYGDVFASAGQQRIFRSRF